MESNNFKNACKNTKNYWPDASLQPANSSASNFSHICKNTKKYWPDVILLPVISNAFEFGSSMDFWGSGEVDKDRVKKYAEAGDVVFTPYNPASWQPLEWHERRIAYFVAQIKAAEMNPIAVFFSEKNGVPVFEVSDGLHRLAACYVCGVTTIPAVSLDSSFDSDLIYNQIIESDMLNSDELQAYVEAVREWKSK